MMLRKHTVTVRAFAGVELMIVSFSFDFVLEKYSYSVAVMGSLHKHLYHLHFLDHSRPALLA